MPGHPAPAARSSLAAPRSAKVKVHDVAACQLWEPGPPQGSAPVLLPLPVMGHLCCCR